jgi:SRSO17 transposase
MVDASITSDLFEIECIGCDASFGSDHTFIDSLPESIPYFASVHENEYVFHQMPLVMIPEQASHEESPYKDSCSEEQPVHVKEIANDDSIPWVKCIIAEGAEGPIVAEIKSLRCISCRKENNFLTPKSEVFVYIRKYDNEEIKYFLSNMQSDTSPSELDRLATARWSVEQCFQECKSHLGMGHYETRSYQAWHRHMLLVMIAQLFVTNLRNFLKKKE